MGPMLARLPLTIWRSTLADLWRLLLLTTAVLVTVISFAAAVQPLADGKLAPADALRFMAMASVPMLQFAVPFAAAFAATLAYHRMAQDNELVAAHGGGVSHRTLLVPAVVSGIVLAGVLSVLSEQVIPRFLRSMDHLITMDAPRMVVNTIEAGQPLRFDKQILWADSARRLGPDPKSGATERLVLTGVLSIELDRDGNVIQEHASQKAWAWFSTGTGSSPDQGPAENGGPLSESDRTTSVRVLLERAVGVGPENRGWLESAWLPPQTIRDRFDDDPRFLTAPELADVPANPDRLSVIDHRRRDLAYHLAERATTDKIRQELASSGLMEVDDEAGRRFYIRAADLRWREKDNCWQLIPARNQSRVEVWVYSEANRPKTRRPDPADATILRAEMATFQTNMGPDRWGDLTLNLELHNVSTEEGGVVERRPYYGLIIPDSPLKELLELTSRELLAEVDKHYAQQGKVDGFLERPAADLRKRLAQLNRQVIAQRHGRVAMSASCLVMVAVGAVTAMRLRGATPLAVYLWSFFPALGAVVTIRAGERMVEKLGEPGLVFLWSAVVGLAVYAAVGFMAVRKH